MIPAWNELSCKCGNKQFIKMVGLRWHSSGGGTSEEVGGYKCSSCGAKVNMADLINNAKLKQKRAELESLREEVEGPAQAAQSKK